MCGIAGYIDWSCSETSPQIETNLSRMAATLGHRGPDDSSIWSDSAHGVGLAHRRLSIIDLSPEGRQPMISEDGRYVITFNGEIYNFRDIRLRLERSGDRFRGHSDTEVMLAAICRWGLPAALTEFNGMFAFALWDRVHRKLDLARDRMGEKPLYFGNNNGRFFFASELKALRANASFRPEINRGAVALYVRHGYIPCPHSIYQGIFKLPPGTTLTLRLTDQHRESKPVPYWSARTAAHNGTEHVFEGTPNEAVCKLENLLKTAVGLRMHADVPVGAFLSGGIDSSTVAALMQAQSGRRVNTFSIGFSESSFNEAHYAKRVAAHLGTNHTEFYVSAEEAMAVIPRLPAIFDEPFSDSSQIPTFLVSQLARREVTVSLSGDGGDELFGGYTRYHRGCKLWRSIGWLHPKYRRAMAGALSRLASIPLASPVSVVPTLLRWSADGRPAAQKVKRLVTFLQAGDPESMYLEMMSCADAVDCSDPNIIEPLTTLTDRNTWAELPDLLHRMMYFDLTMYLPDDILVKVDRSTMAASLESRIPLLDHNVVEFAWRLPPAMLVHDRSTKWPLRQVLYRYVPEEMFRRPKMGFAVPIGEWLRGPLREWADDLLDEKRVECDGFFDAAAVRRCWTSHLAGERDAHASLWAVLMFNSWLDQELSVPVAESRTPLTVTRGALAVDAAH
jgi:asparagine synthase (glutamine-hydrolysing)